ncbi:hypothetical protein EV426DRAFT_634470 [Tirmania nivea]|nr:hypothetical protein EV426DRAFT_634470 [Tirmania nivea]
MPKDDYTAVAGGRLKLKGVSDGRVDKKKKKKKDKTKEKEKERDQSGSETPTKTTEAGSETPEGKYKSEEPRSRSRGTSEAPPLDTGKTEAERRFEERKRRRLDERLLKGGGKSHKERVEEFNKYLANLSEHHDMPRIGPG